MNQPLSDIALRHRKAVKILHALSRETTKPLSSLSCVDIGCAYGLITESLAEHFQYTLGVDSNPANLQEAKQLTRPKLGFIQADARQLPLKSDSVDIVICAQVYEHVAHNDLLLRKYGGFSNRLASASLAVQTDCTHSNTIGSYHCCIGFLSTAVAG